MDLGGFSDSGLSFGFSDLDLVFLRVQDLVRFFRILGLGVFFGFGSCFGFSGFGFVSFADTKM